MFLIICLVAYLWTCGFLFSPDWRVLMDVKRAKLNYVKSASQTRGTAEVGGGGHKTDKNS